MKAFITGISGFAGSHLTELLLESGIIVYGLVRPEEDISNITHLLEDINLVVGDITKKETLDIIFNGLDVDVIYHLAGEASAHKSFFHPDLFFNVNVLGTINLFEAVRQTGRSPRILLVTSSEIYGFVTPDQLPLDEGERFHPESPYAVTKIAVHFLGKQYFRNYKLPVIEARAFNHIGPRQALGFVVPDFCSQITQIKNNRQEPIISVGNLNDKRDFVDVRDVVRAYKMLVEKGEPGSVYNICSGSSISIQTLLEILIRKSEKKILIKRDPQKIRPSKMPEILGNNIKLIDKTGWKQSFSIDQSLSDTLNYWIHKI